MMNLNQNNNNENSFSNPEDEVLKAGEQARKQTEKYNEEEPREEPKREAEPEEEVLDEEEDLDDSGVDLPDRKGAKSFLDWIAELTENNHKIDGADFAREFLIWYQSGEDYEREKHEDQEKKYQQWIEDAQPKDLNIFERAWKGIKNSKLNRFDTGKSSAGSQRMASSLLDKRVSELQAARLTTEELTKNFKKTCKLFYRFEAQSFLLALAWNGNLMEEDVETYYKSFGVPRTVGVYNEDGSQSLGLDGKPIKEKIYVSDKMDQWFTETKLRQDATQKGARPDAYENGRRTMLEDVKGSGVKRMVVKSAEWQASSTDSILLGSVSRRGEVAYGTHIGNNIEDNDQARAIEELLRAKLTLSPQTAGMISAKIRTIKEKIDSLSLEPDQKLALEDERDRLQAKMDEEYTRNKAIEHRLKMGIKEGDFKSFLLDPTDRNTTISIQGDDGETKTYTEAELAVEMSVRKYWQARSETEVRALISGQHVKGIERETYLRLMGDKFRREFMWSSKHHIFGVRRNGKYDKYRDAALQITEFEKDPRSEKVGRDFLAESRNFRFDGGVNMQTKQDIIAYHPDTHKAKRISENDSLYPKTISALLKFSVEDIKGSDLWNSLPDENDPALQYESEDEGSFNYEPKEGPDPFVDSLAKGVTAARQYLIANESYSNFSDILSRSHAKLKESQNKLTDHFDFSSLGSLNPEQIKALKDIIQGIVSNLNPNTDRELDPEQVIDNISAESGIDVGLLGAKIREAIDKFSAGELENLWTAQENLNELSQDYNNAQNMADVEGESQTDVSAEDKIIRISSELEGVNNFLGELPQEESFDLENLTNEQKNKLRNLVENPGHSLASAYAVLIKRKLSLELALSMLKNEEEGE